MNTIQGTIIQFIPKQYQQVPNIQDLLKYYSQHQIDLDDNQALGMVISDDDEKTHTFYASVSLVMNDLNHSDEPIKIKNRVAIDYTTGNKAIEHIKVLPVLFERNQEHATNKDAPEFVRRGAKQNEEAQSLLPFNPLLAVPNNLQHKDDPATIFSDTQLKDLRNPEREMKEVFDSTLKDTDFGKRSKDMFQQAEGQTQNIVDLIFHNEYLDFTHTFNRVYPENFQRADTEYQHREENKKYHKPNIRHMNL